MDATFLLRGVLAGVVATFFMLPVEVLAFQRFGIRGVFEWHEVRSAVFRVRRKPNARRELVFALHLLAGGVAGLLFAIAISLLGPGLHLLLMGLGFGGLLFLLTLDVHFEITGVHPWENEMGRGPAVASAAGHLLYGAALGLLMVWP